MPKQHVLSNGIMHLYAFYLLVDLYSGCMRAYLKSMPTAKTRLKPAGWYENCGLTMAIIIDNYVIINTIATITYTQNYSMQSNLRLKYNPTY